MKSKEKMPPYTVNAQKKTQNHPCFNGGCHTARMHLPVAPACNIACNYCNRKYDCVNESRPGVSSEILTPAAAAAKFEMVSQTLKNLSVIGIAGPGDALANFSDTAKTIALIRELDSNITVCLSTNGLMLPHYAEKIAEIGVTHATVTVNAIEPGVASKIYREVHYAGKKWSGEAGAAILIQNQLEGLKMLAALGVVCKVNIVMIKNVNDFHIKHVVRMVKACGAYITNIMPMIPVPGSVFENMQLTNHKELNEMRRKCAADLQQMYHCRQCRADAIGPLNQDCSELFRTRPITAPVRIEDKPQEKPYLFAVATKSGRYVDEHFGRAEEFFIYHYNHARAELIEKRSVPKYCTGAEECLDEDSRAASLMDSIKGCDAVLTLRIGYRLSRILENHQIKVFQTCDRVEDAIANSVKEMEGMTALL